MHPPVRSSRQWVSLLIRSGHRWYLGATHDHGGSAAEAGCGLSGSGLDEAAETTGVSGSGACPTGVYKPGVAGVVLCWLVSLSLPGAGDRLRGYSCLMPEASSGVSGLAA